VGLRKNQRDLTAGERSLLVDALLRVKDNGTVDRFARIHEHHFMMNIHRSSHFLPWHREFLLRFERELNRVRPGVTLPYWDSSVDRSPGDSLWNRDFLGQFDSRWNLGRALGSDVLPSPTTVSANQSRSSYSTFWSELERDVHNPPHRWVAGAMARVDSPRDPVFYLHHAWIDLLWVLWRQRHPDAPFQASQTGAGLNDPLMEYPDRTPADVLDHHALGYAYDVEPPPTGPAPQGPDMRAGEVLGRDGAIRSANERVTLTYQSDGNLVLYGPAGAMWASGTDGQPVGATVMQADGNLVIYGPGSLYVWDSATDLNPGSHLAVQDDGNAVIYRPDGAPIWATGTQLPTGPTAQGSDMHPGEILGPGQSISSADGRCTFVYQSDGNLVLYGPGGAMWASGTDGSPVGAAIMQGDGNLVIYGPGSHYVWDSATDQNPGSHLVVQNDGNAVIYRPDGTPVWATGTQIPPEPGATFEAEFYLNRYADLRAAFGRDFGAARRHWESHGLPQEGRRGSRAFDVQFYVSTYPDLAAAFGSDWAAALHHWAHQGLPHEGRRGSRELDVQYYLGAYGDLAAAFGRNYVAALDHWLHQGLPREGRRGSREFDVRYYLAAYPDLAAAFGTDYRAALDHWVTNGFPNEGRQGAP
jgi:tyrosinase